MGLASNLIARLILDKSNYTSGLKTADKEAKKFSNSGTKAFNVLKTAGVAAFMAIVAGTTKAIIDATAYEKVLANVATMVTDNVVPTMDMFHDKLLDQSKLLGEDVETLGKGLYDILSAGITDASDAMNVLEVSAIAARAGLTDTGVAADALTTIINAYGLEASEAETVSDLLFKTVQRGKTTFAELAPSIGRVATIAAQAGVSMEEMGASLAVMTRRGVKTDEAVTALRAVITGFLKPSEELAAQFGENALQSRGLADVLNELAGMSPDIIAKMFPNVRGMLGVITAAKEMTSETQEFIDTLADGSPTMDAFNKQTDTFDFTLNRFNKTVKAVGIEAGEKVLPGLQELLETLTKVIDDNKETLKDFAEAIGTAFSKLNTIITFFAGLGNEAETTDKKSGGLLDTFKKMNPVFGGLITLTEVQLDLLGGVVDLMDKENKKREEVTDGIKDETAAIKENSETAEEAEKKRLKEIEKQKEAEEQAKKERIERERAEAKERAEILDEFAEKQKSEKKRAIEDIEELAEKYREAGADRVKLETWVAEQIKEINEKYLDESEQIIEENAKLREQFYDDQKSNKDKEIEDIYRLADEYSKAGIQRVELQEWMEGELEKIDEKYKAHVFKTQDDIKDKTESTYDKIVKKIKEAYDKIEDIVNLVMDSLGSVLDAYYNMQLSYIDANVEDEEEAELEKAKLARQMFFFKRAETLANIAMNTAEAITKALSFGPIIGPILAGIIGGLALIQTGFVLATKPPALPTFKEGGWVDGVPGIDAITARVSKGEYIVNADDARKNRSVLEYINAGGKGMPSVSIMPSVITVVASDGRIIGSADLQYIQKMSKDGGILIHPRAVSENAR
jgi:TP901 family phage tail tape measure protein